MRAAQWDTDAEIGGDWSVTVRRRADGVNLAFAQPTVLSLWAEGLDAATAPPTRAVTATLSNDTTAAVFRLSAAEVGALGVGRLELRLTVTDGVGTTRVVARGWFRVRGRRGDL